MLDIKIEDNQDQDQEEFKGPLRILGGLGYIFVPFVVLIMLFSCSWLSLAGRRPIPNEDTRTSLKVDYSPWNYVEFKPLDRGIISDIQKDRSDGVDLENINEPDAEGWFWWTPIPTEDPNASTPTNTRTLSPTTTQSTGSSATPTLDITLTSSTTPTETNTPSPTPTQTPAPPPATYWFYNTPASSGYMMQPSIPNGTQRSDSSVCFFSDPIGASKFLGMGQTTVYFYASNNGSTSDTLDIELKVNSTVLGNTTATLATSISPSDLISVQFTTSSYLFAGGDQLELCMDANSTGLVYWDGVSHYSGLKIPSSTILPTPTNTATTINTATTTNTATPTNPPSSTSTPTPTPLPTWTPSPTPINASLGTSKTLTSPWSVENGNPVTYEIVITNTGAEILNNVQVSDNLDTTFGAGTYSNVTVSTTGILTPNGSYNGSSNTDLLLGTESLAVGASETITLSLQIDTVSGGIKSNTANSSAVGAISGTNVNSSNSATVRIISTQLLVVKTRTSAASVPNGSAVVFSIVVSNPGNDDINNVQVTDSLNSTFGAGTYSVTSVTTTGTLTPNGSFNGAGNTNLLASGQTLLVGNSETITLTLQINTVTGGLKTNSADASGTSATLFIPVNSSSSATVTVLLPNISVSKTRTSPFTTANGGTVVYSIVVTNTGAEILNNVQVTDNLNTTFGAGTYTVTSVTTTGTLTANWPGFDGSGNTDLLLGTQSLGLAASETITLSVQLNTVLSGLKTNTANASGTGAVSSFGVNASNSATVTVLLPNISVSKTRTSPFLTANGSTVVYSIVVNNTGAEILNNVQVTDNLNSTFGAGYTVTSVTTTGTLTANWPGFNGSGNTDLLLGTQSLGLATSETITLSVQLNTVPFGFTTNTAIADGTAAFSGSIVSDSNNAFANVQPPAISVTKTRASAASVPNGSTVVFSIVVTNSGLESLSNVQVTDSLAAFGSGNYSAVLVSTTGTLTPNGAYNGSGNNDLLLGTQPLGAGASETITLSFQINTVPVGLKTNTANAEGWGTFSGFYVSASNSATVTVLPPVISVTKTRTSAASVPNGSTIVFSIVVSNTGLESLSNVQVTDSLAAFGFGNYSGVLVSTTGTLTPNGAYNGSVNDDLLLGTQPLGAGASETITLSFQINIVPGGLKTNTANAEGWGTFSGTYVSASNSATVTVLPPAISVTKTRTSPGTASNGDTVIFSIVVANTGAEILNNVQVTDSLDAAFGAGTYSNVNLFTTGTLTANPGYSGTGNLLLGTQPLGIGASETITLSLQIDTAASGAKTNTAFASGTGAVSGFGVNASNSATVTVAGPLFCPSATLTNFAVAGNTVSWDLNNGSASSFNVLAIFTGWSASNGNLTLVTLGGNIIWSGSDAPLTASIIASGITTVGASSTKTLVFTFASPAQSNPFSYTLIVTTDVPCVISP